MILAIDHTTQECAFAKLIFGRPNRVWPQPEEMIKSRLQKFFGAI